MVHSVAYLFINCVFLILAVFVLHTTSFNVWRTDQLDVKRLFVPTKNCQIPKMEGWRNVVPDLQI